MLDIPVLWVILLTFYTQPYVDPSLAIAVGWHESRWDPYAVSRRGAVGIMQTMPEWYRKGRLCYGMSGWAGNVMCGTKLLGYGVSYCKSVPAGLGWYHTGKCGATKYSKTVMWFYTHIPSFFKMNIWRKNVRTGR